MTPTGCRSVWTIVVAAGTGSRFGGEVPKQFVEVAGRRVVDHSIVAAAAVSDGIVVVVPAGGLPLQVTVLAPGLSDSLEMRLVDGGETRSASVRNGLAQVPEGIEIVLVHDAARPLASPELFGRVVAAIEHGADAVVPAVPVVDTLRGVDGRPVDRAELQAVQTPQGFSRRALASAHRSARDATDDATLVQQLGLEVVTVPGERWNLKVTEPSDELVVAALLAERAHNPEGDRR